MNNNTDRYGILAYTSANIGDEIQSIASMRFLPRIDEYIQRENIKNFVPKNNLRTKLIMNAWWMLHPNNFPPKEEYVEPLLISMYIRDTLREKFLLKKENKDFLIKNGPVGCRDMGTYKWLKSENIPTYFSGCLTLTIQRNYDIARQNYILCVDVPPDIVNKIKQYTSRPVYTMTRTLFPTYTPTQRFELAKIVLRAYHDAHLVISPRLHVILPSLAMETPVLRLKSKDYNIVEDYTRYDGYESFFNTIDIDKPDLNKQIQNYNFDNPPANPQHHLELREQIIKKCSEFTGYDNKNSLIDNDPYPLITLIGLNRFTSLHNKRMLYWNDNIDILNALWNKLNNITKYKITDENSIPEYKPVKNILLIYLKCFRYYVLHKISFGKQKLRYKKKYLKSRKIIAIDSLYKIINKIM